MKTLANILFIILLCTASLDPVQAQNSKADKRTAKEAEIKQLIQSKNYVFKAQYVFSMNTTVMQLMTNPIGSNPRYLNSNYDVTVKPDTVTSYLPYFGEAYFSTGYNSPADNGIQFTSTKFDYRLEEKTNGNYLVYIKPKDARYTQQMILTVSKNGSASLSVQSVNRQMIRFDGYIEEDPKAKI